MMAIKNRRIAKKEKRETFRPGIAMNTRNEVTGIISIYRTKHRTDEKGISQKRGGSTQAQSYRAEDKRKLRKMLEDLGYTVRNSRDYKGMFSVYKHNRKLTSEQLKKLYSKISSREI